MDSQLAIIDALIEEGKKFTFENFSLRLDGKPYGGEDSPAWITWKKRASNIVTNSVSKNSAIKTLASKACEYPTYGNGSDKFDLAKSTMLEALRLLKDAQKNDMYGDLSNQESSNKSPVISNKVFVVHGHDDSLKNDVERFLHELGLQPIVLHRQVDEGNTVIEKFEKHSDVGYAFILLTPDEISYTQDQALLEDAQRKTEKRARPNVIFEFGYFVGKLTRSRVCCVIKGDVSVPSDLNGLVYKKIVKSIEEEAWSIVRELKAAGYNINLN